MAGRMTGTVRSPVQVTLAVWWAIFQREAQDRLFDMRGAWFWMLLEPALHIAFITFIFTVIRVRSIGNADVVVWIVVGMLLFFFFRRTAVQVTHAVQSSRPMFTYRQVKPFDPAIARAVLEFTLMSVVATIIFLAVALLGHDVIPHDPLMVLAALFGLWLFGLGYGLVAAVLIELVPEMKHVLRVLMLPLYLISGVIFPLSRIPQPWLDYLMINPIPHALELARQAFFPYYRTLDGLSLPYVYAWAVASLFLGLLLFRRFANELVMR